ncbi:hypothetical protein SAMN04487830_1134 [Pseudobutyrivibrio sp. OR37]|uniref:hypothetical protein n=1 Tax=Pseudobutyrivibrio sp. OR37 TaxID=1798186 RepID=UPI0008EC6CA0|nr:hypothetical protein [Pseudobutyrivibrio sp. OR37]SFH92413.1 hypothetical protein SAMN04487830_1134 [Pseudobutyrivibrio sp. OR37]
MKDINKLGGSNIMNAGVDLSDVGFRDSIVKRKNGIDNLVDRLKLELDNAPDGSLRITNRKSYVQYYWRKDAKDTNGAYIHKEDMDIAKALAQKEYNKKLLKCALKEQCIVNDYSSMLEEELLVKAYDDMHSLKKELVTPFYDDDITYKEKWKAESYEPMGFSDNTDYYSGDGVRVRSKSELIIANLLEQYGIPYKYEKPIVLDGLGQVRPDFVCLNIRTRREYVWEHFGMMDNAGYANKNISKMNVYQQNGYYLGKNMIATFETSAVPLSSRQLKGIIEEYLV